jgi:hypothetical protein
MDAKKLSSSAIAVNLFLAGIEFYYRPVPGKEAAVKINKGVETVF